MRRVGEFVKRVPGRLLGVGLGGLNRNAKSAASPQSGVLRQP
jgi:hypothetical protein